MQNQNNIVKYAYFFEKENVDLQHIFGSIDELHSSPEKALEELDLDRNENEDWLNKMIREKGEAYVAEISFQNGQIISVKKLNQETNS